MAKANPLVSPKRAYTTLSVSVGESSRRQEASNRLLVGAEGHRALLLLIVFVLWGLVMSPDEGHAEWALFSGMKGAPTNLQGAPSIWIMSEAFFSDEGKCQTAAQVIRNEQRVQTHCVVRIWRIYWQPAPKVILPARPEIVGKVVISSEGGTEIQRSEPTVETGRVFDTEVECHEQLRGIVRPPSPGGAYACIADTPNWP